MQRIDDDALDALIESAYDNASATARREQARAVGCLVRRATRAASGNRRPTARPRSRPGHAA